jgi:hypothetical protein
LVVGLCASERPLVPHIHASREQATLACVAFLQQTHRTTQAAIGFGKQEIGGMTLLARQSPNRTYKYYNCQQPFKAPFFVWLEASEVSVSRLRGFAF